MVLPNAKVFSYLVAFGEFLVGAALILGLLTGIAALLGGFLKAMFLLAGTASSNPWMFATWRRTAGDIGLDYFLLRLGVLGAPGSWFRRRGDSS